VFLRGAEVFFAPQIRDFPPRFHARLSVFAYLCPAGPIGYPPMHGSSGDRAGGDDSPRRSFQIRLHVATCACIALVLPVEVRAAAFGGFTTFSGDVRVHGWCLIAGTGISSAMAGRAGRRFSCLGVRLERWMLIALTLEWRGVS
jgi:hypothetical protein